MSDLRKHLAGLGKEYQSARYPGNLADDVLGPRWTIGHWFWNAAAALATAALIALALWLRQAPPTSDQPIIAQVESPATQEAQTDELAFSEMPAVSAPQFSSDMDMAPTAPDFSFSAPSFTLISDEKPETTSTTREAV